MSEVSGGTAREDMHTFKGRSWMLPSFLIAFSIYYFYIFRNEPHNGLFWFTGFSYLGLGILYFFIRRPMIKVGKKSVMVRRFNRDRMLGPEDLEEIVVSPIFVSFKLKTAKKSWAYSKLQYRFKMDELSEKLKAFALDNKVTLKEGTK